MQKTTDSTTIRVSKNTREVLKDISRRQSQSMQTVLDAALEKYKQHLMIREINEDYGALRKDKKAWSEELKERTLWESALSDGLDDD